MSCVLAMPVAVEKTARARRTAPAVDKPLYARLVDLREKIAFRKHVAPYLIFTNATLEEMSVKKPRTRAEMLAISGMGERKFALYGEAFLQICKEE